MAMIVGPGSKATSAIQGAIVTAEMLPLYASPIVELVGGTPIEFKDANETHELPVPIPRLAGLDDIELDRVGFRIASSHHEEQVSVSASVSNGAVSVAFNGAAGATVRLERIELEDFKVTAASGATFVIEGSGADFSNVVFGWDDANSKTTVTTNGDPGEARHLHFLVRPPGGPPLAAAPYFEMPGAGKAMYGAALGGAYVSLLDQGGGKIKAVLRLNPSPNGSSFSLLVGHADKKSPHEGLPNDVATVTWSAANITAFFDVRPSGISVKASAAAAGADKPAVSEFPADPGDSFVDVDFAGVARSLLKKAYPQSQGSEMGLKLLFSAKSPGIIQVKIGTASARYLSRPLEHGPAKLSLLGAPESLDLAVSKQFKPAALSFTIDGIYGPARLTLDSDTAAPETRRGFRVAGATRVARLIALTAAETNLPLARIGLFGRASESCELLVSLHKGDALRIGAAVAEPLSLELDPDTAPAWHRKEYAAPRLLPPQPDTMWVVVQATRGAFWWHGPLDGSGSTQRSDDDGATFSEVAGRPMVHVSVTEVDAPTGNPTPVYPVRLFWRDGLLNADIVGVQGQEASLPPDFRRFWIAEGAAQSGFLNSVPGLDGLLRLTFNCQRDVDLTVSDAVLTYDPWNA